LVTETAPNQVTLQAFPVPKWGDMKVRIGITCPLQPQSKRSFNFGAPHLLSANFDYKNAVTEIKMESDADANVTDSKSSKANGSHILMGNLKTEEEKNYFFNVNRSADFDQITTRASHSAEDSLISERLLSTHRERLRKLAVVVEANTLLADQKKDLANWLQNLPDKIETKAIFASRHEAATPLAISEFNKKLETISLDPGSKDSAALAQAKELIGRDKYGAVLWIHGPQPVVFQEDDADLKSLMDRGARRLKIYDCQLGGAQANEIANYMRKLDVDASPRFIRVDDAQSLKERLTKLEQAQFGAGDDLVVERTKLPNFHKQTVIQDFPTVSRVSSLWAADEARKAASLGDENAAVLLGTAYRVVTPVTGAVVMEKASDYEYQNLKRNFYDVVPASAHAPAGTADGTSTLAQSPPANLFSQGMFSSLPMPGTAYDMNFAQAPSLEGATNGTIGPQGTDADFVTGVNTAGGVRVNNLANLEALLLLTANGLLLLGVIWGTVTLLKGVFGSSSVTNAKRLIYGSAAILFGLMSPATISFLLATARDANLFS
jgi:hypothetical protein